MTCMAQFLLPLSFIAKVIAILIEAAYWLVKSISGSKPSKSEKKCDIKPMCLLPTSHNRL